MLFPIACVIGLLSMWALSAYFSKVDPEPENAQFSVPETITEVEEKIEEIKEGNKTVYLIRMRKYNKMLWFDVKIHGLNVRLDDYEMKGKIRGFIKTWFALRKVTLQKSRVHAEFERQERVHPDPELAQRMLDKLMEKKINLRCEEKIKEIREALQRGERTLAWVEKYAPAALK